MNKDVVMILLSLSFVAGMMGILVSKEDEKITPAFSVDEHKWLNYPKAEYMVTAEDDQVPYACKALQEHQKNQPRAVHEGAISPSMLWKLKNDELHAQCSIETIEQTIARLQEQLKKDREQLQKAKTEQDKIAQP